jgi:4-amino-4-deoxy-L-arabinose transferase-like glycosyltransferase
MRKNTEIFILSLILILSGFIRFYQLGYSHFYGDEIKTLYLRKDVSAFDFLMNQRKGPAQFVVSWMAEKVSGGYKELWIRFPYAIAGTLLVLVFYIFVRQNFGVNVGLFSTALFSLNGFYIAFSRIAQYQVLYLLFGFLCLIFARAYVDKRKLVDLIVSSLSLSCALLSHYDAVFFLIPLYFIVNRTTLIKIILLGLILPSIFYIPNVYLGFFSTNTFGYITKRLVGENYIKNNSLYTILVYNPLYVYVLFLLTSLATAILRVHSHSKNMLIAWTVIPFLVFQFLILNPGTHIHNYVLPIIILAGVGLNYLLEKFWRHRYLVIFATSSLLAFCYLVQLQTYIPNLNNGYPWKVTRVSNDYHLYLYGFPYYRGWDHAGKYFKTLSGVKNFYTNDNETVAEYYLYGIPCIAPIDAFLPQYYVQIISPQELQDKPGLPLDRYSVLWVDPSSVTKIYKRSI